MGRRSKLDYSLLLEFFPRWKESRGTRKAGEIVRQLIHLTGLSKVALNDKFNKWLKGENLFDLAEAKRKREKNKQKEQEWAHRKEIAMMVSALQRSSQKGKRTKQISVERALRILIRIGKLIPEEVPTASTVRRWQKEFNITMKDFFKHQPQNRIAHMVNYKYSNHVFSVDASVLDKYFLNLNRMKFEKRPSYMPKGDNHESEYMEKNNLVKVWVYYALDCYSGSYWLKAFIPTKREGAKYGGENSTDMRDFLIETFLDKRSLDISSEASDIFGKSVSHLKNVPLNGVPEVIYCDNGSPCNTALRPFLNRLGIKVVTHYPGNPRAKPVEALISQTKKVIETQLGLLEDSQLRNMEILNFILQAASYNHCHSKGRYTKYLQSALVKPIQSIAMNDIRNALLEERERVIDNYGNVKIAWDREGSKTYKIGYPGDNIHPGTRVYIYRDIHSNVFARDMVTLKIYKAELLIEGKSGQEFGTKPRVESSSIVLLHKEIDQEGNRLRKTLTIRDVVDPIEPIFTMPPRSLQKRVDSLIPPEEIPTVEEAKEFIVLGTGVGLNVLSQETARFVHHALELEFLQRRSIRGELCRIIINRIIDEQTNYLKKTGV
jgi:hypothetical protein